MKKIVIAGGTGFIGTYLAKRFKELGYEVLIVSREPGYVSWNPMELEAAINNSDVVINLSGKSINCRHTKENKKKLLDSRIEPTIWIGNAIQTSLEPPKIWINASASGLYKPSISEAATEDKYQIGTNFLAELVEKWETTFFGFELRKTRQIALRTSVVIGKNGGALKPLLALAKLGLGGKQASGKQMISWIHLEDYFQVILFVIEQNTLSGAINCTSAQPVSNKLFLKNLRKAVGVPFGIPAPKFLIKMGALLIGTESSLLLDSSFLLPTKLTESGFKFNYPDIKSALKNILKR